MESQERKKLQEMEQNVDRLADLVPDILIRLPVKSLMRFKCVNKTWYHLINNPNFISEHLHSFNNHINLTNPINLLVNRTRPATVGPSGLDRKAFVSLLSFDPATNSSSLNLLDLIYHHNEVSRVEILGPCNGLYCLYSNSFLIINPSTREFRILPDTHDPPKSYRTECFPGFGFDPKTNDYKVVLIIDSWHQETDEQLPWRVEIYTLSSNCWRNVDCPLPSVSIWYGPWIDAFVHGAFHWWAYDSLGALILAFDLQDEMFRTIRLPNVWSAIGKYDGTVAKFRESLAVIVFPRRGTEKWFELWVMEDYGNEGSWIKHSIIGPIVGAEWPLGFLEKRDLFLFEDKDGRMVLYDLQTKEIKHTGFHGEESSLQAVVYMESLVSLRRDNEHSQVRASFFDTVPDPLFDGNSG